MWLFEQMSVVSRVGFLLSVFLLICNVWGIKIWSFTNSIVVTVFWLGLVAASWKKTDKERNDVSQQGARRMLKTRVYYLALYYYYRNLSNEAISVAFEKYVELSYVGSIFTFSYFSFVFICTATGTVLGGNNNQFWKFFYGNYLFIWLAGSVVVLLLEGLIFLYHARTTAFDRAAKKYLKRKNRMVNVNIKNNSDNDDPETDNSNSYHTEAPTSPPASAMPPVGGEQPPTVTSLSSLLDHRDHKKIYHN